MGNENLEQGSALKPVQIGFDAVVPELAEKYAPKVTSTMGKDYRVIYLSQSFDSEREIDEVGAEAAVKFLKEDLEDIATKMEVRGNLCPPSIMKLMPKAYTDKLAELTRDAPIGIYPGMWPGPENAKVLKELENAKPYRYAVFAFVAVTVPNYVPGVTPFPMTEKEFMQHLKDKGLKCAHPEGVIGGQDNTPVL